jgi:hypothetical protein
VQQVADARQVALSSQRGTHFGLAADQLDFVAPGTRGAHCSGDWSQRRVVAAHGVQRDSHHQAKALFTNS